MSLDDIFIQYQESTEKGPVYIYYVTGKKPTIWKKSIRN